MSNRPNLALQSNRVLTISTLALLTASPSQALDYKVLAYTGMEVTVGNETLVVDRLRPFSSLGVDSAPVINANGDIAFWTKLENQSGQTLGDAIWSYKDGVMTPIAVAGQPVPGSPNDVYRSNLGRRIIIDGGGNIGFGAQVVRPSNAINEGLFVYSPGNGVRKVVLEGDTVPQVDPQSLAFGYEFSGLGSSGAGVFLQSHNTDYVFNGNSMAFTSAIANPDGPGQFTPALYVERPSFSPTGLDLIARSGADTSFFPSNAVPAINPNGEALFRTTVVPGGDDSSFTAIATYNQANISYIAMSGSDAGGDVSFSGFSSIPGFNGSGQSSFVATFTDLAASDTGIFKSTDPNGIVATEGIVAAGTPDLSGDGVPDFVFINFNSAIPSLINKNGKVVFQHTARTPDGSLSRTGLWSDRTGPLTALDPIVFVGDHAPGMPEDYVFTNVGLVGPGRSVIINDKNEVAFMAQVRGDTGPIETGLWAEIDGELTLIAVGGIGQTIDLPDGSTLTIEGIDFAGGSGNEDGRPSGFSDNGEIVLRVDQTTTIGAHVLFSPFGSTLLGDLNGDGVLTDSDISAFVQALTDPSGYASAFPALDAIELGDFNDDGQFTNGDIAGFVDALNNLGINTNAVPEPTSLALVGLGGLLIARRRR